MTEAQVAIKADESIESIGKLLDQADRAITAEMMEAQTVVRPLQKAASPICSPELALTQQKAALGKKYEIAMRKPMRAALRSTFEAEAKAINPTWELPSPEGEGMAKWAEALMRRARKAKRDQRKLQNEFLEQKLRESVSAMATEEEIEAIETILQRDKIRQNHRIIQRRLKRARMQLKCVIGDGGQSILVSDMPKAFVKYHAEPFKQPRRNRATAADGGDFCNGLRPYRTQ